MRPLNLAVLIAVVAAACREPAKPAAPVGQLDVRWSGSRTGSLSGVATAGWCAVRRVLEIRMVRGDTGIALALYPAKGLKSGAYPIVDPVKAESIPPAAAVAVRWLTQSIVQGFQGDGGRVVLERSDSGRFSGSVSARARSVVDTQRIVLSGTFRNLTVGPDTRGCRLTESVEDEADTADSGVN